MRMDFQRRSVRAGDFICDEVVVEAQRNSWETTLRLDWEDSLPYLCWQKAIDLLFGLMGILCLLLLLPVFALLIYVDSPGPIFYCQERLGLRGKAFRMYKFRSMCVDAEREGAPRWAIAGDSRVTRVGRILRATHLDELPQAFNILRGDMSLIGPRPEREISTTRLAQVNPLYRSRLLVKPGLTGWAQVTFGYGGTEDDELRKLHYDLEYIQRRSVSFDLVIILKTVVEVLGLHGR